LGDRGNSKVKSQKPKDEIQARPYFLVSTFAFLLFTEVSPGKIIPAGVK